LDYADTSLKPVEGTPIYDGKFIMVGTVPQYMGKTYSVYIKDDEMCKWIDAVSDDVFGGTAPFFQKSSKFFKDQRGQEIDRLRTDEDGGIMT